VLESDPTKRQSVSGRYTGAGRGTPFTIELRIDVDGPDPLQRVSADIFDVTAGHAIYCGSLIVDRPERVERQDGMTLMGPGTFTSTTATAWIEVRVTRSEAPSRATLARFDRRGGRSGPVYDCTFQSPFFRRVELTEDCEEGVDPVEVYDTAALRSAATGKRTIVTAFADAGVDLQVTGERTAVATAAAGADGAWSDPELHAAMARRLGSPTARDWAVWLLHARLHKRDVLSDGSQRLLGIMFDEYQRHGCAVFYHWLQGRTPEKRRQQLFACVHEIGHAFNLQHCWQTSLAGPARPDARSWLNNPDGYPGGEDEFWSEFPFEFDQTELAHLRHAFLDDVVMGGRPLAEPPPSPDDTGSRRADPTGPGLRLRVFAPRELLYGVPATIGLELSATSAAPQSVAPVLGPRPGSVDILIRRPNRTDFVFEPLVRHCRGDAPTVLRPGDPPVRDYAFVHYGRHGFSFGDPGRYELRARYVAPDGTVVLSPVASIDLHAPMSQADRDARRLLYGNEQGLLMSLMGSGRSTLRDGDVSLQEFAERHPHHPAAAAAQVIRATSAARDFKTIATDGSFSVDSCDEPEATALFGEVLDIDHLRRAIAKADAGQRIARAAYELTRTPTRRGVPAEIDVFIRSRRHEIAAEIAGLS